jgi:Holliday junction resolvase
MTARNVVDAAMSEAEYQAQIIALAVAQGWRVYHTHDSRRSHAGWPDLICVRGAVLLALEVKAEKGKATLEQEQWIAALKQVKYVDAAIVKPSNWNDVEKVLTAKAR